MTGMAAVLRRDGLTLAELARRYDGPVGRRRLTADQGPIGLLIHHHEGARLRLGARLAIKYPFIACTLPVRPPRRRDCETGVNAMLNRLSWIPGGLDVVASVASVFAAFFWNASARVPIRDNIDEIVGDLQAAAELNSDAATAAAIAAVSIAVGLVVRLVVRARTS